jgi:NAD(P)-dependent dehydrogenase (short-subunit alcohol dehydrogenase family)
MLLENKTAVIYGAGGDVGGAVAKAFAREGAKVFLTGRTLASVQPTARDIIGAGGVAEAAQVDAMDEKAIEDHLTVVTGKTGGVDVSFNAITAVPQPGTRGVPLAVTALDRTLLDNGLVDEYDLWIMPTHVGQGKRAFADIDPGKFDLELVRTHKFGNGVVVLTYRPHQLTAK